MIALLACLGFAARTEARPLSEASKPGSFVRLSLDGALDSVSFQNGAGQTGYFSTKGFGGAGEVMARGNGYGLGLRLAYLSNKGDNSANTSASSESISFSRVGILARIYALDFHLGLGVDHTSAATATTTSSTLRNENYSGLGIRIEGGYDFYMGNVLFLSPRVYYSISKLRPESSTGTSTFNSFGAGVGLGLSF